MSGILWGGLGSIVTFIVMAALGDMVSEEVRDRLDHLPHAILRRAAQRLGPDQRGAIYEDEWLPELTYILKGDEARPVTRLYHGTRYALGILVAARTIKRHLAPEAQVTAPPLRLTIGDRVELVAASFTLSFLDRTMWAVVSAKDADGAGRVAMTMLDSFEVLAYIAERAKADPKFIAKCLEGQDRAKYLMRVLYLKTLAEREAAANTQNG